MDRSCFPSESFAYKLFCCFDFQFAMIEENRVSLFDYQKILNWIDLTCKHKANFVLLQHCFCIASGDTDQSICWWQFLFSWQIGYWQSMSWHSLSCNDDELSQCDEFHFDFGWLNTNKKDCINPAYKGLESRARESKTRIYDSA